jgi:hypothetical protein
MGNLTICCCGGRGLNIGYTVQELKMNAIDYKPQ